MKTVMTLRELVLKKDSIKALAAIPNMPVHASWKLAGILPVFEKEFIRHDKARGTLVMQFGKQDETNKSFWKMSPDLPGYPEYQEKMNEIEEEEISLEFDQVPIGLLGKDVVISGTHEMAQRLYPDR